MKLQAVCFVYVKHKKASQRFDFETKWHRDKLSTTDYTRRLMLVI